MKMSEEYAIAHANHISIQGFIEDYYFILRQALRNRFCTLCSQDTENGYYDCNIVFEPFEAQGVSSNDFPRIVRIHQTPGEGWLDFYFEGCDDPVDFDNITVDDLMNIHLKIEEYETDRSS